MKNEPAFPELHYPNLNEISNRGMTLRDYFAGQALIMHRMHPDDNWNPKTLAKFSYECADAMLLERSKGAEK